jgi:O-antigen ligase
MRSILPAVAAMAVVAAFMPIATWQILFARSMEIIIAITIFAILTSPTARATVDPYGVSLTGWRGYFIHKNVMSPVLSVAVVTILAFETNRRAAWAFVLAAAVVLVPSRSATGLIALVLGLSVWGLTGWVARSSPRDRSMATVTLGLTGVLLVGVAVRSAAYWVGAFDKDITFTGRTEIWAASGPYLADRPLTGYGLAGPYSDLSNLIARDIFDSLGFYITHAHNGLIDVMATLGLVGVAIVVTLIVMTIRDASLLIDRRPELSRWVMTMMVVVLFTSFTENTLAPHYVAVIGAARILVMRERGAMTDRTANGTRYPWRRENVQPQPGLHPVQPH